MSRRLQGGELLLVVGGVARCHGAPLPCGQPTIPVLASETHRCRTGAGERQHRALAREDQPPPLRMDLVRPRVSAPAAARTAAS